MDASEASRLLAARRRRQPRACAVCGTEFSALTWGLYCSPRCTQRAAYWRYPDERRARRREYYWRKKAEKEAAARGGP
jgi:hypothetical protein